MTQQPDTSDIALMLHELREDPGDQEELEQAALSRVRQRLAVSLTSHAMADATPGGTNSAPHALAPSRRPKWSWGARSGLLAALGVGTALGASGHAVVSFIVAPPAATPNVHAINHPAQPSLAPRAKADPVTPPPTPAADPAPVSETTSAAPQRPRLQKSVTEAPAVEAGFDPELRELEVARRALATNPSQALDALRLHRLRYPSTVLSQEREALTVKALVAAGRHTEARAAAVTFSQRHPGSMLLGSVQSAIRSIP